MTCGPADVDLGQALMANVQRCKYTKPTPVQRYSIPIGIAGRDLMACAQTGSGKTAAFCFPIIANILRAGTPPAPRARKVSSHLQHPAPSTLRSRPAKSLVVRGSHLRAAAVEITSTSPDGQKCWQGPGNSTSYHELAHSNIGTDSHRYL